MNIFDFDEWMKLAKTNPDEFEARRQRVLREAITSAPKEHHAKLYLLQAEVDAIRQTHEPLESTILVTKMLADNLNELEKQITRLKDAVNEIQRNSK